LNHQSGLLALSCGESDVKALEQRAHANDKLAAFALETFAIAVRKAIGGYMALLGGIDLLVFTAELVSTASMFAPSPPAAWTGSALADKIQIVPAQEEEQMARHCRRMMKQR
jgi:acetate kinase